MIRRIRYPMLTAVVALVALPSLAMAQDPPVQNMSRFNVLVPDFRALEGADRGFGKDVAKELRVLLGTLLTHRAIERDVVEDALDTVDRKMEELDCVTTRQLASMMDAEVALCASYTEGPDGQFAVTAVFWDVQAMESFTVEPTAGAVGEEEAVARHIYQDFERYTTHVRAAVNCEAFAQGRVWDRALENCDEALRLNPDAIGTRYRRARVLFESDRPTEALDELERVLEADPVHEAALQLAGYISATLDRTDDAHAFYSRFLELSPANATVRMRVAYELAQAGDPRGAMLMIREGLDIDADNPDLWQQLGGYAFTLGESIYREGEQGDTGALAPDAVTYYRDAIEAYEQVFATRGRETAARLLRSLAIARLRLGEFRDAVAWAEQGIEIHSGDAALWSVYGDALRRAGRLADALDALTRVQELDPEYPSVGLRRGSWLLEDGRISEAVDALREVAVADPERADGAARLVLADAHANGVQQDRYGYAIEAITAVRELPGLTQGTRHELDFWLGYSTLRAAAQEQEPRTLETARSTLPKFQRALELLGDVGEYPSRVGVNIQELRSNVGTYIEIQEAIIRRGGSRAL